MRQARCASIFGAGSLKTQCRGGLEEAIVEKADMQSLGEELKHRANPLPVHDTAGEIIQILLNTPKLMKQPRRGGPRGLHPSLKCLVMLDDIIELSKCSLSVNLTLKPGGGASGIAFEHRNRGMLILNFTGDGAEGPIGDVPSDRTAKLTGCETPRLTIGSRDRWRIR